MESLAPYVHMLHELREPLLVAARDGTIVAANAAAADALGTSIEVLEGASLATYALEPASIGDRLADLSRPFTVSSRDGRRFTCDARALAPNVLLLRLSGGPESAPRARLFFEALLRLKGITTDPARTLQEMARARLVPWMRAVGVFACGVYLLDESNVTLELVAEVNYPAASIEEFRLVPLAAPIPLTQAVKQNRPVVLRTEQDFATQFSRFVAAYPFIAFNGLACIPLEADGRCIGVLGLGFSLGGFNEADQASAREFAHGLALALERVKRLGGDLSVLPLSDRMTS